jgi:hypothetical protein
MPEFVDRHDEHEAWKQEVLAGNIKLDVVDMRSVAGGKTDPIEASV